MPIPSVSVVRQDSFTPSIIGISTQYHCIVAVNSRKAFYVNGRFWVFYSDGTNLVYSSTIDGVTWTTPVSLGLCYYGYHGTVFFDGTYLHHARYHPFNLYYRRGIPDVDGTITWSAEEQTVYAGTLTDVHYAPMTAVDSEGYAWIGTLYHDGTNYLPKVFKNAKKDGTWTTAAGFPYTLNTVSDDSWWATVVPLTNGKVYTIYARGLPATGYFFPLGRLYDGKNWGDEETNFTSRKVYGGYTLSAVNQYDDVHLCYLTEFVTPQQIRYNRRVYGVGWREEDELIAPAPTPSSSPTLSINKLNNDLYCFWAQYNFGVFYKRRATGKWDDIPTTWIREPKFDLPFSLTSFYRAFAGRIGLLYSVNPLAPFYIKFNYLNLLKRVAVNKTLVGGFLGVR